MGQFDSLIGAANKTIDNTYTLLESENPPFNAVYKQYKILRSFWFRVVEDAADFNSSRLEDLCVDLEEAIECCSKWISANPPTNQSEDNTESN